jgi:CBS domain-containing protein
MITRDVMTREVITVGPALTVKELAKVLVKNQISGVPVADKRGKIIGIVSEADIVAKKGKMVKNIMTPKVIAVHEEMPVEEIASLMTQHRISRVPVMRDGKLAGIVSRADIISAIAMGKHIALHTPVYDL